MLPLRHVDRYLRGAGQRDAGPGRWPVRSGAARLEGALPKAVERIDSPTRYVWIIGRVQTNGPADYPFVHRISRRLRWPRSIPGAKAPPRAADVPFPGQVAGGHRQCDERGGILRNGDAADGGQPTALQRPATACAAGHGGACAGGQGFRFTGLARPCSRH
jgi:hypothetical protein